MEWSELSCWAIPGLAALGGAVGGAVMHKQYLNLKEVNRNTYVQNVMATLEKQFIPPVHPRYPGAVLARPAWLANFLHQANNSMHLCYYGPSNSGKSTAIAHALSRWKGIINVKLPDIERFSYTPAITSLCHAVGLYGKALVSKQPDLSQEEIIGIFTTACKNFRQKHGRAPVMLVGGIQKGRGSRDFGQLEQFASTMVQLSNDGILNVVYITSDLAVVRCIREVCGEKTEVAPFPTVSDNEMVDFLNKLPTSDPFDWKTAAELWTRHNYVYSKKFVKISGNSYVLPFDESGQQYVVNRFGCHVGDSLKFWDGIVQGLSVEDAVQRVIVQSLPALTNVLLGNPYALPNDREVKKLPFLATAHATFALLAERPNQEVVVSETDVRSIYQLSTDDILQSFDHLALQNLVSFVGNEYTVTVNSRKLKYAYLEAIKDPAVKDAKKLVDKHFSSLGKTGENFASSMKRTISP